MSRFTNRAHVLVAYDITDDKRRTKVFKTLLDFGNHVQFSVFLCEIDRRELAVLRRTLREAINHAEDQVMFVHLGPATHAVEEQLDVLGVPYVPPGRQMVV
jgi:CRISPR-associated protein Cas2